MDLGEQAAEYQQQEIDRALAALKARAAEQHPPRDRCIECSEAIPAPRVAIGAERCIDCQRAHEARLRR